jgi:hypothetical protein
VASHLDKYALELERRGLARAAEVIRTKPDQALPFIATFAAHVVAEERGLALVTDDPVFSATATYFTADAVTSEAKAAPDGVAAADLLVPTPSPEALESLTVDQLVQIRAKLGKQRRAFRQKVEKHKAAIAELPSVEAVRDQVKTFAEDIRDDLEAQRAAMSEAKVKQNWSFLSVTAPASLAVGMTLAGSAAPILGPIAGAGAVALGVSNWYVQRRKRRPSTGNYVLSLEKELGRKGRGLESGLDQLLAR